MSNKITENEIELFVTQLLEKQGFEYIYAPDVKRTAAQATWKRQTGNL